MPLVRLVGQLLHIEAGPDALAKAKNVRPAQGYLLADGGDW
jgi:hypothetical protein